MNPETLYDVVILGGGVAGLTAALYLARAQYRVLVIEKETFGGQITITEEVVNYPGIAVTTGTALAETMRKQAEQFGAEFLLAKTTAVSLHSDIKTITTTAGTYSCFGVLIATGAHPRSIGFPGETAYKGHGVAYCATCDGEFFTDKEVFVLGGGFAAAEESVFLTRYARHVTILMRKEDFSCPPSVAKAAKQHPKITILPHTEVVEASGDSQLKKLVYRNLQTGAETIFQPEHGDSFGIFVFAGYEPETALVKQQLETDEQGYLITDRYQKTNLEGVYAAGDVCVKHLRQVVTAVGDGAVAATELEKYAAMQQKALHLYPQRPVSPTTPVLSTPHALPHSEQQSLFSAEMIAQLQVVFSKLVHSLILELHLDSGKYSETLRDYMQALTELTNRLSIQIAKQSSEQTDLPFVRILRENGSDSGLVFHGVPGGHEFTSFIMGLYNVAGPGQPISEEMATAIAAINHPVRMQVFVSLSCTMCPELAIAAQKIAANAPNVTAEIYDIALFPTWKDRYQIQSVPCLVISSEGIETVSFGKKDLSYILSLILK